MSDGITQDDVINWVRSFVWSGEYDEEEVGLLIEDQLGEEDQFDESWLRNVIHTEVEAKQQVEQSWPKVTDFHHLDRTFLILEAQGIIALHRAGFTQSDGLEVVVEAYHEAGGKKSNYAGHCFYTQQDQEGALYGSGLYIGFGHLSGSDAKGVEVGRMLSAALAHDGFQVEWDGTIDSRVFVKGFRWQRRSPW